MITGTITPEDYLAAQRLHRHAKSKWYLIAAALTVLLGAVLWIWTKNSVACIVVGAGAGGIIGELITSSWYLPRKVRKLHRQQRDLASPFIYAWDSEWIEARGMSGQSRRRWDSYLKVREDAETVLLYHADNLFEMFPKRWFTDRALLEQFKKCALVVGKPTQTMEPAR